MKDRDDYPIELCTGKNVLHIGACDAPLEVTINKYEIIKIYGIDIVGEELTHTTEKIYTGIEPRFFNVNEKTFYYPGERCEKFTEPGRCVNKILKKTHAIKNNHFRNVHTYYFNKYTLNNVLKMSGLEIKKAIEGDFFLISELAVFARKSEGKKDPFIDTKIIAEQERTYKKRLNNEDRFTTKIFYLVQHWFAKYRKKINNLGGTF